MTAAAKMANVVVLQAAVLRSHHHLPYHGDSVIHRNRSEWNTKRFPFVLTESNGLHLMKKPLSSISVDIYLNGLQGCHFNSLN